MEFENRIFLAHASEDKIYVKNLYLKLKENKLNPWLDEFDLMPGVNWNVLIKEVINNCRFFIACLSRNSISKNGYIQKELKLALSQLEYKSCNYSYFIPALIEDVELPNISIGTSNLREYQAVKLFDDDGVAKLIEYLCNQLNLHIDINNRNLPNINTIKEEISKGEIEHSLKQLIDITKNIKNDFYNRFVLLLSRFNSLKNENNLGLISRESFFFERNKLIYAILETVDSFDINHG